MSHIAGAPKVFLGSLGLARARPGNNEIGNTSKFRRDGEKRMPDSESETQNYIETTGFISVQKKKFHFVDLCISPKAFYNPIIITPAVRNKLQFRGYMNATNSHGLFKNRCVCIILPENPAAERVSQNVFPLLLLLFRSLKSL